MIDGPTTEDALLRDLLAAETRVWQALKSGDIAEDEMLLHDAFLGVYPDGFAAKADHVGQLQSGPSISTYALSHPRVMRLAEDVALLSYHARFARAKGGTTEHMYVSSIWDRSGGHWVNIFSQDTPASD